MKRMLAVFLCMCIAFLPAIGHASEGTKLPGFYKSLAPPLPRPPLVNAVAGQPKLNLTVTPKSKPQLPGSYMSLAPPLPRAKSADATNLTVAPKSNPKAASALTSSSASSSDDYKLPDHTGYDFGPGIHDITSNNGKMVVEQNAPQAIQNWKSFDIGSKSSVYFDQQKNPNWVCLNRIWDQKPSQIFGKLTADGQIYLINQNGILFGQGSQVNVHTLIASSLYLSNEDFLAGKLNFQAQDYQLTGNTDYLNASVTNQGTISTDTLGSVFLLGPSVTNSGTIKTQAGQIGLAAGTGISLSPNASQNWQTVNVLQTAGDAANIGTMKADTGLIDMYGANVRQNGSITAVTGLQASGEIDLKASNMVFTGAGSVTATPISTSTDTADQSLSFNGGTINIMGLGSSGVQRIVLRGLIQAPSGAVTIDAEQRVFVENGSRIDVSGSWEDKAAADNTTKVQLNSVELRDDYGQKNGILKGSYITFDNRFGSSIGDVSGALTTKQLTALDRSLQGGKINISSESGDVIVKKGASVDFSGGGIRFGAGDVTSTRLISGNKVYDISNAPEWLHYDYVTNASSHVDAYVQGSNAGTFTIGHAKQVTLDGNLNGSVIQGAYQTKKAELLNGMGEEKTLGLAAPVGGTLNIGASPDTGNPPDFQNFYIDQVVIKSDVAPLPAGFGPNDDPYVPGSLRPSVLSAQKLSAAGLNTLNISSNTSITTEQGAVIALQAGGSFSASARSIVHNGVITVPSGTINLTAVDNFTSFQTEQDGSINPNYIPMASKVYLGDASTLSAAGQIADNSLAGNGTVGAIQFGLLQGGNIEIRDVTYNSQRVPGQGVFMKKGASVDVSGGYQIDASGRVTGGDAGTLTVEGSAVVLDGSLRGYSLTGNKGGDIILHASQVTVAPSAPSLPADFNENSDVPDYLKDKLVLAGNRLDNTGFTRIELKSINDINVESGVTLSPSLVKMATPEPGSNGHVNGALITVSADLIGTSYINATAGVLFDYHDPNALPNGSAGITTKAGSAILAAPGNGSITIAAPNVDLSGLLNAPSGTIKVTASQRLILESGSKILAKGYNKPDVAPVIVGLPLGSTPVSAGAINLAAVDLTLQQGSTVDVSGSSPAITYLRTADGMPLTVTAAGNAGSLSLSYSGSLALDGQLSGSPQLAGVQGGSLTITQKNQSGTLTVSGNDINRYKAGGFDALTFVSSNIISLSGSMNLNTGRSLTLDAPQIMGSGSDNINLQATQIKLADSYWPSQGPAVQGSAKLNLSGKWLDIVGSLNLSGFSDITLKSDHDLTLSDNLYHYGTQYEWNGKLQTAANLTLGASRIYPTTQSNYTINTSGIFTTLPSAYHGNTPIYSAGGNLTIQAEAIDHMGFLAAPMGSLTLIATGDANGNNSRVYLDKGSTLTTAGNALVEYGTVNDVFWTIPDKAAQSAKNNTGLTDNVQAAPGKSVVIEGNEVITRAGSNISLSGGGRVFSYQFQGGIQGTLDPFQKSGVYVILPDNSVSLPGPAVYLSGGNGISPGVYSLLPEQYAFVPGAMVIADLHKTVAPGRQLATQEGYEVVAGYSTVAGANVYSSVYEAYSVTSAADVKNKAYFNISGKGHPLVAGDAGSVALTGKTTVVDGAIQARALKGFRGGAISLSATDAYIGSSTYQLADGFNFNTPVSDEPGLKGTLQIAANALYEKGFEEIDIGNLDPSKGPVTDSVTMYSGAVLQATGVKLSANGAITLDKGAQIITIDSGGNGSTSFTAGWLDMESGSLVHSSDQVALAIGQMGRKDSQGNFQNGFWGDLQIDHGVLNLTAQNVYFAPAGYSQWQNAPTGLVLTNDFWGKFSSFKGLSITATGNATTGGMVEFLGDMNLFAKTSVTQATTINAAKIEELNAGSSGVIIDAPTSTTTPTSTISLLNTGSASAVYDNLNPSGTLTFNAAAITAGKGDVRFDGFSAVNLNSENDLTFAGAGSLSTQGDLNLKAARVTTSYYIDNSLATTSYYQDDKKLYTAAAFKLNVGGALTINPGSGAPGTGSVPGGSLSASARSIDIYGTVDVTSGQVNFTATGSGPDDGIFLRSGSSILARGSDFGPGGQVSLSTEAGSIDIEAATNNKPAAKIDVSAGKQGDAGSISLYAPSNSIKLGGDLSGKALGGVGGSFSIDTLQLSDLSALNGKLSLGGLDQTVSIRVRTGDVALDTIKSHAFSLVADSGNIDVWGKVDASGTNKGGQVEIYAGKDLTLHSKSHIDASASEAGTTGGDVLLSSATGSVIFDGSVIDVSGGQGGTGGTVHLRALRDDTGNGVKMSLNGTITGASQVYVEANRVWSYIGTKTISNSDLNTWMGDAGTYMNNAIAAGTRDSLTAQLHLDPSTQFNFMPGIEVQSTSDINLNASWDLSAKRYSGEPGFLTLRAGRDLNINQNLVDSPNGVLLNTASPGMDSWGMTLVAGSQLWSAGALSTAAGTGNLNIGSGKMIYSENAPIRFAAGNNMSILGQGAPNGYILDPSILYSLGTFNGSIKGTVGGNLTIKAGAIQSAVGDIDINVGGNLGLQTGSVGTASILGSIRTTGQSVDGTYNNDYLGGSITLNVGGQVQGAVNNYSDPKKNGWDYAYGPTAPKTWSADYESVFATQGLAAMGGGDVVVHSGGSFYCQAGTFGTGNLEIYAGGDLAGRFLVENGRAKLNAMGNFGRPEVRNAQGQIVQKQEFETVETFNGNIDIAAQGKVLLASIVNPTLIGSGSSYSKRGDLDMTYLPDASVNITSVKGDVIFSGTDAFSGLTSTNSRLQRVLPATLEIHSGNDILVENELALAPSPKGNLVLDAKGNIDGTYTDYTGKIYQAVINVSDMDPLSAYGYQKGLSVNGLFNPFIHDSNPLHGGDNVPVEISAAGNIQDVQFQIPKQADVTAGVNIKDIYYLGQNVSANDITKIRAGGEIEFSYIPGQSADNTGIQLAGPGSLEVQAGGSIDLGTSAGIRTVGNAYLPQLGSKGSSVIVIAGYDMDKSSEATMSFFDDLRQAGSEYSQLQSNGDLAGAMNRVQQAEKDVIDPFFHGTETKGAGDINMTSSQISTASGQDDIFIFNKGTLNVGKSTFFANEAQRQATGIYTAGGGGINIFSGGDVNVNESRVMTFFGGDITVWSDHGNVVAGRGSKTAVSASPPKLVYNSSTGSYNLVFSPPAVGSGVRAVSYPPGYGKKAPRIGDIYMFAPKGTIDAGEAGIAGRNVILGAVQVLNASNISFSGSSVGVPVASSGVSGLTALAGTGTAAQGMQSQEAAVMNAASNKLAQNIAAADAFSSSWLEVRVLSFFEVDPGDSSWESTDN